ncbi:MAG TPA: hypothetical protein V6D17_21400 [Candidatus Obscuribacterales bacterium]
MPLMRTAKSIYVRLGLTLLGMWLVTSPALCAADKTSTRVFYQSSNFVGTITTKVSPNGMSMYFDKPELESAFDRARNKVLLLNHRDKTYMEETGQQWEQRAKKWQKKSKPDPNYIGFKMIKASTSEKIAGQKTVRYDIVGVKCDGKLETGVNHKKQIWVSPDVVLEDLASRQFVRDILKLFAQVETIPEQRGALLRVSAEKGKKMVVMFDTYKVEKVKEPINVKVPKNYKRVKDEVALLWGDTGEEGSVDSLMGRP